MQDKTGEKTSYEQSFNSTTEENIRFPYEPTAQQQQILKIILQTIKSGKNCLIESATGTGKTLCLLTSCLTAVKQGLASRVYYLTRTHSQMECILKQFNESGYDSTFAMVQSKKGLCANQKINEIGKNYSFDQFQNLCAKAHSKKQQNQHIPRCGLIDVIYKKKKQNDQQAEAVIKRQKFAQIYFSGPRTSILQIKHMAAKHGYCPNALESFFGKYTKLVIMSYKYMCNSMLFGSKKLAEQLKGSILIFDEAHNIIQTAKDQSSIELSPFLAQKAIQNILQQNKYIQTRLNNGQDKIQNLKLSDCLFKIQKYAQSIKQMDQYFQNLYYKQISSSKYSNQRFVLVQMLQIYEELLKNCLIRKYKDFFHLNKKMILNLSRIDPIYSETTEQKQKKKCNYIVKFTKFCYMLSDLINSGEIMINYLCVLQKHLYSSKKKSGDIRVKVNFVCLSSKYTFQRLRRCGARSIIFASGTLNHADFEETELEFLNYFQKSSNFQKGNVSTFLINSHNNAPLQILSDVRKSQEREVVEILSALIPQIPFGVLVFFKSYDHLQKIRKYMIDHNADVGKTIFWECRKKYEFEMSMKRYVATAQTRQGAVLMAVCRGKVSEGYNFKDNLARAVFIVGYPLMSPDCLAYKVKSYVIKNSTKLRKWYYNDAMMAVKQAIGRGIRHPKDFACIYLIGQKLYEKRKSLPNWLTEDKVFEGYQLSAVIIQTKKFMDKKENQSAFNCEIISQQKQIVDTQVMQKFDIEDKEVPISSNSQRISNFECNQKQINSLQNHFEKDEPRCRIETDKLFSLSNIQKNLETIKVKTDSDEEDDRMLIQMLKIHKSKQQKEKQASRAKRPIDYQFNPEFEAIKKPRVE